MFIDDGDLAQLRIILTGAANDIERGYTLTSRAETVALLRATAEDLHTPESRAQRDAMRARLAAARAGVR